MLPEMTAGSHLPEHIQRVVLTGFMGSGKTTTGRVLARRLEWRFADLDDFVSQSEGLSVPEIFARQGEAAFRTAEVNALRGLLTEPHLVIALGGGAPETPAIRELLAAASGTVVVHLHAPFEALYARCLAQAADPAATSRPLLGEQRAAAERFARRLPVYAQIAHGTANADAPSAQAVADEILGKLTQLISHV